MPFADDSSLMLSNGTMVKVRSTFVSEGTQPVGSTWQMLPIPDTHMVHPGGAVPEAWAFTPPCYEPRYPADPLPFLSEGRCSGQWITNITIYTGFAPEHLPPGEYVLGLRDCETSAQVWQPARISPSPPRSGRRRHRHTNRWVSTVQGTP